MHPIHIAGQRAASNEKQHLIVHVVLNIGGLHSAKCLRQSLADLGENRGILDIVFIVGLEFGSETIEGALEGVLRGGVDHLWL
jgi:hypothetical protein